MSTSFTPLTFFSVTTIFFSFGSNSIDLIHCAISISCSFELISTWFLRPTPSPRLPSEIRFFLQFHHDVFLFLPNLLRQFPRLPRGRTALRVLRHHPRHQLEERVADRGGVVLELALPRSPQNHITFRRGSERGEHHLVQHHSRGKNVAFVVVGGFDGELLGRGVDLRADARGRGGAAQRRRKRSVQTLRGGYRLEETWKQRGNGVDVVDDARETEIAESHEFVFAVEDVGGLHVAVDHVLPVDVGQCVAELHADVQQLALAHHAAGVLEVVLQRVAAAVGHLDVENQRVVRRQAGQAGQALRHAGRSLP